MRHEEYLAWIEYKRQKHAGMNPDRNKGLIRPSLYKVFMEEYCKRAPTTGEQLKKEEAKTMSPKATKLNKFYCAAEHISRCVANNENDAWTRETEAEAVEHARTMLERDLTKDTVVIVKMVAIVRREKPPVKVTRLK